LLCNHRGQLLFDEASNNGFEGGGDTGDDSLGGLLSGGSTDLFEEVGLLVEGFRRLLGDG
jgi:hypothetical protein